MKKYIFLFISSCLLCVITAAQPQRLAVIPVPGSSDFLSLCVDYFADIPAEGQAMEHVMSLHPNSEPGLSSAPSNLKITSVGKFSHVEVENAGAIKDPFLVGTSNANTNISANYSQFIREGIELSKKLGMSEPHLNALQERVWKYDVLTRLGYLKETGHPTEDYNRAVSLFQNNFGSVQTGWGESRILSIGEGVKAVDHAEALKLENTHSIFISKNRQTGFYTAFEHLGKPLFHGTNKTDLINLLNSSYQDGDNVFIAFDESMSYNNRQAFLVDFEVRFRTAKNKALSVSEFDDVLLSEKFTHTLASGNDEIKQVLLKGQNYFEGRVSLVSNLENVALGNFRSEIIALSPKKNVVSSFVSVFRERFSAFGKGQSLTSFTLTIKRNIEQAMGISKKELVIVFEADGRLSYFTEKKPHQSDSIAKK